MNFDYNETQQLLAESVLRFAAKDYDFEARKRIVNSAEGWSKDVWRTMADMGLLGIPFGADYGGFGGGAVDLMNVMEAIGSALIVEPFLPTIGLGAQFVARAGSTAQRNAILPGVVEGKIRMAFAHTEKHARYDLAQVTTQAKKSGNGWTLTGEKIVVLGAPMADKLVVSARTNAGISLFLVERSAPGVTIKSYRTVDAARAGDAVLNGVQVGADAMLGDDGSALPLIEAATDYAIALLCAEAIGAMKYANDATLEYLKTRKQFGVTIGTFQALQHRMVDMVVSYEQAKSMACLACTKVDNATDSKDRARAVAAAKFRVAEACRHISQEAIQLHGGMGMTEEMKVSHTFRRLTMIAQQFGDADHHLARYGALTF